MLVNEKNSMLSNARLWTKNTCRGIFQERSDAHALERRDDTVQIVTRSKQAQQGRTKESQQHGCRSIHPRSIGKDING